MTAPRWAVLLDKLANAFPLLGRHWQTISKRTGLALIKGRAWAKVAAPIIDFFFGAGHCLRQAATGE